MKTQFLFSSLIAIAFLTACEGNDNPPETPMVVYPQVYLLDGYTYEAPLYFLAEEASLSPVTPTQRFSDFIATYLLGELLPEIDSQYFIREIRLTSESLCSFMYYDADQDTSILSGNFPYTLSDDELVVTANGGVLLPFSYDLATDQLAYCEVIFSNSYWNALANRTDYSGFFLDPCYLYEQADIPLTYYLNTTTIQPLDTLMMLEVARNFVKQ